MNQLLPKRNEYGRTPLAASETVKATRKFTKSHDYDSYDNPYWAKKGIKSFAFSEDLT